MRTLDMDDPTNPYRVTLRKVWAKLAEKGEEVVSTQT